MATFLEVELTVTPMRLTDSGYVGSDDRTSTYYFAVPDAWATLQDYALQSRINSTTLRMYEDLNRDLRAAEPNDAIILRVKSTRAKVLGADEANTWPWISAEKPVWDTTPCAVVNADGSYTRVNSLELGHAVPAERGHVRLDRVLPVLIAKQLPACSKVYEQLYETLHDPRPLDEGSRYAWGAAVLFFCVLDRFATGGEYADPFGTVDEMITWLAEGGEAPREGVESARQIYRRMLEHHVYRPNDMLHEMVFERAWAVRYSDLDSRKPSAFQGFVHCLTGSRDSLHSFDFDDPRNAAPALRSRIFAKVDTFNRTVVLPSFEEIKSTLERHGKRVVIAEDERLGDELLEELYREIHPSRRYVRELATSAPDAGEVASGRARYLGYSIVAVDPEPAESRYAGKFFESVVFVLDQDERVYASPLVFYHMKFDNKLHGFAHRFDNSVAAHEIEAIDKYQILNHFLGAYDFFKIHARRDEQPW